MTVAVLIVGFVWGFCLGHRWATGYTSEAHPGLSCDDAQELIDDHRTKDTER